jgi:signal transduction histidine kinase
MAETATPAPRKTLLLRIGVHECRGPLTPILGYLRMLQTGRAGDLTAMQRRILDEMEKSAAKLRGVVEEMEELSPLEAGSAKFTYSPIDLSALIAQEIPAVASAPEREVPIRLIDQSPIVMVNGDLARLKKSLNSLLFSYRLELAPTDELCVAIDRIIGENPAAVRVTIASADRVEELRRIPESELSPLVEFRSGLGYRLSIARKVIEKHGGRIFSQTEPGRDPETPKPLGAVLILPEA